MVRPSHCNGCANVPDAVSEAENTCTGSQDFPTGELAGAQQSKQNVRTLKTQISRRISAV